MLSSLLKSFFKQKRKIILKPTKSIIIWHSYSNTYETMYINDDEYKNIMLLQPTRMFTEYGTINPNHFRVISVRDLNYER